MYLEIIVNPMKTYLSDQSFAVESILFFFRGEKVDMTNIGLSFNLLIPLIDCTQT
ncbi:hypothetical protein KSC_070980 [Ktedonobacter sp. SOSP1-52]|nr:hypothetical protein KSC_070980 [Ktedonobacter sp. SOSP1-52]